MKRILFVDDEPKILRGLRRMLLDMEGQWDMAFVESGAEALELLAREPFDIIVSDMRMPVMDGAQLLGEVRDQHPHMARIILSGHSDRDMIMKSIKTAHQFLAKPCDAEVLESVLSRAAQLNDLLRDEALACLVKDLESLPSLPDIYSELTAEMRRADCSLERLGEIVGKDLGLSATALKMVNSSFFGIRQEITSPKTAVRMLGLEVVEALVLYNHIITVFDTTRVPGVSFDKMWRHSLNTAGIARQIALAEGSDKKFVDDCYNAGLMHDVGKLALAWAAPDQYNAVVKEVASGEHLVHEVEYTILGTSHGEIGAYLMSLWGLPDSLVKALAYHHRPSACQCQEFTPLAVVHAADCIEHALVVSQTGHRQRRLDQEYIAALGKTGRYELWSRQAREVVGQEGRP